MRYHKIPDETVRRLPIYLRSLMLSVTQGREHISSKSLADFRISVILALPEWAITSRNWPRRSRESCVWM